MPDATLDVASAVRQTWDAVVIGAGPAGALAARQLAQTGVRVLLVEKKTFPRWKVCGACLNEQGLSVLRRVGLGSLAESLGAVPLSEMRLRTRGCEARLALPAGAAVSRERFDAALVQAAVDAGSQFLPATQASIGDARQEFRPVLLRHGGETAEATARVVLAAAGLGNDCLPRDSRRETVIAEHSRIGAGTMTREFPEYYRCGTIFMAVGRQGYVGLVRQEEGSLNVAAAFDKPFVARFGSPGLAASSILKDAGFPEIPSLESTPWQGTVSLTRHNPEPAGHRFFVLGDAAGYVEPFTGEGIAWALADALHVTPLAIAGIAAWKPELAYQWLRLHRKLNGRRQQLCRVLALVLRSPLFVRGAVRILSIFPWLAVPLVGRVNRPAPLVDARCL